jgi:DNA invertase Pin-like site-specific DNA recombinase
MKARYIRTSSIGQNEARQVARQNPDEMIYLDKISGSVPFSERPQAGQLLKDIADGKIEIVSTSSIDRLGRNTINILQTIESFNKAGVNLKVDNLGLESLINGKENPTFKLIVSVLANISEMERASLRERQLEGIAQAKMRGVYKGREKGTTEDKEVVLQKYKEVVRFLKMKKSLRDVAGRCNVSLGTVQRVRKLLEPGTYP